MYQHQAAVAQQPLMPSHQQAAQAHHSHITYPPTGGLENFTAGIGAPMMQSGLVQAGLTPAALGPALMTHGMARHMYENTPVMVGRKSQSKS